MGTFIWIAVSALIVVAVVFGLRRKKETTEPEPQPTTKETQMLSGDELRRTMVHEAGHALMIVHLGGKVTSIDFEPKNTSGGVSIGRVLDNNPQFQVQQHLLVCLAGVAAEEVISGVAKEELDDEAFHECERYRQTLVKQQGGKDIPVTEFHEHGIQARSDAKTTFAANHQGLKDRIEKLADGLQERYVRGIMKTEGKDLEDLLR